MLIDFKMSGDNPKDKNSKQVAVTKIKNMVQAKLLTDAKFLNACASAARALMTVLAMGEKEDIPSVEKEGLIAHSIGSAILDYEGKYDDLKKKVEDEMGRNKSK